MADKQNLFRPGKMEITMSPISLELPGPETIITDDLVVSMAVPFTATNFMIKMRDPSIAFKVGLNATTFSTSAPHLTFSAGDAWPSPELISPNITRKYYVKGTATGQIVEMEAWTMGGDI